MMDIIVFQYVDIEKQLFIFENRIYSGTCPANFFEKIQAALRAGF